MGSESDSGATYYVVTNTEGQWLVSSSQAGSSGNFRWSTAMREAYVFDSWAAARLTAWRYGGYVVALNSR